MTSRRWYVGGLVAAVLVLVLSVVAVVAASRPGGWWPAAQSDEWQSGEWHPMGWHAGGMMGGWDHDEGDELDAQEAATAAAAWLADHEPGATLGDPVAMPMGYVFPVTRDGEMVGTIMVNEHTGQVAWLAAATPGPADSAA